MSNLVAAVSRNAVLIALGVVFTATICGVVVRPDAAVNIIGFGTLISVALLGMIRQETLTEATMRKTDTVAAIATIASIRADNAAMQSGTQLQAIQKTAAETHSLVNSGNGHLLKQLLELREFKAQSSKDPADVARVEEARQMLATHEAAQAAVEAKLFATKTTDAGSRLTEAS